MLERIVNQINAGVPLDWEDGADHSYRLANEWLSAMIPIDHHFDHVTLAVYAAHHDLGPLRKLCLEIDHQKLTPSEFELYIVGLLRHRFYDQLVQLISVHGAPVSLRMASAYAIAHCELGFIPTGLKSFAQILEKTEEHSRPPDLNYILELCVGLGHTLPKSIVEFLKRQPLNDLEPRTLILILIKSWLDANSDEFNLAMLALSKSVSLDSGVSLSRFESAWIRYIQSVLPLGFPTTGFDEQKIVVIGDSHCFGLNGAIISQYQNRSTRCVSKLVFGGKAFHLNPYRKNKQKTMTEYHVEKCTGLNSGASALIFAFGEIDCREDEGIIAASLKGYGDIAYLIEQTVSFYIEFVQQVTRSYVGLVAIMGVPAVDTVKKRKEGPTSSEVAIQFNESLKTLTTRENLLFIDISHQNIGGPVESYQVDGCHVDPRLVLHQVESVFPDTTELSN